jgi:hypothetical protein
VAAGPLACGAERQPDTCPAGSALARPALPRRHGRRHYYRERRPMALAFSPATVTVRYSTAAAVLQRPSRRHCLLSAVCCLLSAVCCLPNAGSFTLSKTLGNEPQRRCPAWDSPRGVQQLCTSFEAVSDADARTCERVHVCSLGHRLADARRHPASPAAPRDNGRLSLPLSRARLAQPGKHVLLHVQDVN